MNHDEFITKFEDGSLVGKPFHHADHVKMAFHYLSRYPALEALERFSTSLAKFATAQGMPDLYNETITWAFFLLIRERMARAEGEQSWEQFAAGNADLLDWKNNILKRYYQEETLASPLAKHTFLFPDKDVPSS